MLDGMLFGGWEWECLGQRHGSCRQWVLLPSEVPASTNDHAVNVAADSQRQEVPTPSSGPVVEGGHRPPMTRRHRGGGLPVDACTCTCCSVLSNSVSECTAGARGGRASIFPAAASSVEKNASLLSNV
jgi:hypothetical protein